VFRFSQLEVPWELGPPDGRYLIRPDGAGRDASPSHVLVLTTLGAEKRSRVGRLRRQNKALPEPEPSPVATSRATIVDVGDPLASPEEAAAWLSGAGETELAAGVAVLNRAVHSYRLASADPHVHGIGRRDALVARLGYGAGEEVADGLWTDARELIDAGSRRRRSRRMPAAQARLAALLTGRHPPLATEELALRARLDLDEGRAREASLQVLVALDAAVAELAEGPAAPALVDRLEELRSLRPGIAEAARAALGADGSPETAERDAVAFALGRIEAALRARAAALPG
jgi:hypothetical protein